MKLRRGHGTPRLGVIDVIPTPEELGPIAALSAGSLADTAFPVLLHALALHKRTATLEIRRGRAWKRIALEAGVPVDCRSNLAHETLSRFMVGAGLLRPEEEGGYLGESISRGVRFGEILMEKHVITAVELERVLQQNLAKKLLDGFSWRDGTFELHSEVAPPDSPLKVNVPQLVLLGINKLVAQPDVEKAVATLIGKKLSRHPNPPHRATDLTLPQAHRQVLDALGEPRRIDELAVATKLSPDDLSRAVYALAIVGFIGTVDRLPRVEPAPSAPAPPAPEPAKSVAPQLDREELERLGNEITMLFLVHRRLDPFDLLGIDDKTPATAVNEAYLSYAERYSPWPLTGALADKARTLFMAGARAYAELADPATRERAAERRLARKAAAARPAPAPAELIKTDLLDPEVQFRKGLELMSAHKLNEAITQFEYAVDIDSQSALYRATLAWCRFQRDPTGAAERALGELRDALRIDTGHGLALYYSGEIHRSLGNRDVARMFLERAIKPMSPDRRPIDALRSLMSQPAP